jgi:biotin operon repressor
MIYHKGYFVVVPNYDYIPLMTNSTVKVYLALCKYANAQGQCYPSQNTIAKWSMLSRRQISRCIDELKQMGLITAVPQERSDGGWTNNLYQIQQKKPKNDRVFLPDPIDMGVTGGIDTGVTLTIPRSNYTKKRQSKLISIKDELRKRYNKDSIN